MDTSEVTLIPNSQANAQALAVPTDPPAATPSLITYTVLTPEQAQNITESLGYVRELRANLPVQKAAYERAVQAAEKAAVASAASAAAAATNSAASTRAADEMGKMRAGMDSTTQNLTLSVILALASNPNHATATAVDLVNRASAIVKEYRRIAPSVTVS